MGFLHNITVSNYISTLDWIVFILVLLATFSSVAYGHYLKKKQNIKKEEQLIDLLLMGRRLTLPLFIATLVATWYGGIFGVTAIAFNKGLFNFLTQGVFWYITYLIFAFFLVHKIKMYNAVTLPNLILKMFGPKSAMISAVFNIFNVLPIVYTISIGIFFKAIFGGPLWLMMILGIAIVIIYSIFGGLRAVIFSDIIQFFVMCLSVFLVLIFSLYTFGGLAFLKDNLPATHFSPTGGESISTLIVWGLIALSTLVDPNFYQRCFAAASSSVAKKGIIFSTVIWFFFDICTTFGAMYAKATIPEAEPNMAYLFYSLQVLPEGLRGLFLGGILATILSTLDSYLFLAGTTISYDLLPKKLKNNLSIHYLSIVIVGIVAIILANYFDGNIKLVWKTIGSYFAACLLIPVTFGYIFPKKISDNGFVITVCFSAIATTYWRHTEHIGFSSQIDELYIGSLVSLISIFLLLIFKKRTLRA